VLRALERRWPDAECALVHRNAYELLVATILSAQCTDARVNLVTPEVFRRWPDAHALARATQEEANVVRGVIWGLSDGVVVDTHVARIAARLGWTRETDPGKIEKDLMELHPRERWIRLAHVLIHHGRGLCLARKPRCEACPVNDRCPSSLVLPGRS
jgi:endonuclease-3